MTARHLFLSAFFLVQSAFLFASGVAGQVSSTSGEPLPFAAIFVKETGTGTVANEDGYYEVRLEPGRYTVVYQFLGYETVAREVTVRSGPFTLVNVTLKAQVIQLRTVEVRSGREDPAYTVMRRAIAKAAYHRQQIESYTAQVYIKGSGRLKKAPFFLRKELKKEGIDSSYAFVSESVSKISYKRPATFKETVISVRKQGNDNETSPAQFINGSFYEPEIAEVISPLSPKAFAYYKFKHSGYFVDRGYGVNKIQVIPRSRGDNVAEGYIYILEDLWSIYSLSLKTFKLGIGIEVDQTYAPIDDKAWLPIKHQIGVDGTFFGFAFEYNYIATVSDYRIELNPALDVAFTVIDEKAEPEAAKALPKPQAAGKKTDIEQRLAGGQEVTMKDLRKIVREYEKEDRKEKARQDSLVTPVIMEITEYKVDSLAYKRDSAYWSEIRPVPLTLYEVRGYQRVDSIAVAEASKAAERDSLGIAPGEEESVERKRASFRPQQLLLGGSYRVGKRSNLSLSPMLSNLNFNPVEGFHTWTDLRFSSSWKKKHRLILDFTPRYALAPNRFSAKGGAEYRLGTVNKLATFRLEGGRYIYQFNPNKPISEIVSTYFTLFEERNFIRLFEKEYLSASFRKRLLENVSFDAGVEWARRFIPGNRTTQVWFGKEDRSYDSNIPVNEEWAGPMPRPEKAFVIHATVEARPWQKYRIRNGRKEPVDDSSPVMGLSYRKGLSGILGSVTDYDLLDLSFQHRFRVGARGNVDVKAELGAFLNNTYAGFADYRHFMGNRIPIVTTDPVGSFRLLDYYRHSTAEEYAALHVHYQFRKLLFTRIPKIWLMGIKENAFINYLATPTSRHYTEVGYSLDNIFRVFRVEAVTAFQGGKYYDWGIRLGIASNLGFLRFD